MHRLSRVCVAALPAFADSGAAAYHAKIARVDVSYAFNCRNHVTVMKTMSLTVKVFICKNSSTAKNPYLLKSCLKKKVNKWSILFIFKDTHRPLKPHSAKALYTFLLPTEGGG